MIQTMIQAIRGNRIERLREVAARVLRSDGRARLLVRVLGGQQADLTETLLMVMVELEARRRDVAAR